MPTHAQAKPTILVVDDDPAIRRTLSRQLEGTFRVSTATSYAGAIMALGSDTDICALVSDCNMGSGAGGTELMRAAHVHFPDVHRIIVSGSLPPSDREQLLAEGVIREAFGKPWDQHALLATLTNCCKAELEPTRSAAELAAPESLGLEHHETPLVEKQPGRPKILIVDDSPANLVALSQTLRRLDVDVVKAGSGNEALKAVLNDDYALCILDVHMPTMDGFEVARFLRKEPRTKNLAIIFLTAAMTEPTDVFRGYAAGGYDYLVKPFEPDVLLSKAAVFLDLDRERRQLELDRARLEELVQERTARLQKVNEQLSHLNRMHQCLRSLARTFSERHTQASLLDRVCQTFMNVGAFGHAWAILIRDGRVVFSAGAGPGQCFRDPEGQAGNDEVLTCFEHAMSLSYPVRIPTDWEPCSKCCTGDEGQSEGLLARFDYLGKPGGLLAIWGKPGSTYGEEEIELFHETGLELAAALATIELKHTQRITQQMLSESQVKLQQTTTSLIQSEKLSVLGELASSVAHDLNQPLNVVRLACADIQRDISKGRFEEQNLAGELREIGEEVAQMGEIIDNISSFARKSLGKNQQRIELGSVIERVLKLFGYQLKDLGIETSTQVDAPLWVVGDHVRLQQVVLNLIGNARDALQATNGSDGATIQIKAYMDKDMDKDTADTESQGRVVLEVRDNGEGLPPGNREQLFESFFTTKPTGEGTGLGLSITKRIVEEHQGTIEAFDRDGGGAVFRVTLPSYNRCADE